jgi:hypothetical protein
MIKKRLLFSFINPWRGGKMTGDGGGYVSGGFHLDLAGLNIAHRGAGNIEL